MSQPTGRGDPTTSTQPFVSSYLAQSDWAESGNDHLTRWVQGDSNFWKDERQVASLWRWHRWKWKMGGWLQILFCTHGFVSSHAQTTVLIEHLSHIQSRGGSETNYSSAYPSALNQTPRQSKSMSNAWWCFSYVFQRQHKHLLNSFQLKSMNSYTSTNTWAELRTHSPSLQ